MNINVLILFFFFFIKCRSCQDTLASTEHKKYHFEETEVVITFYKKKTECISGVPGQKHPFSGSILCFSASTRCASKQQLPSFPQLFNFQVITLPASVPVTGCLYLGYAEVGGIL